MTTWTPGFRRGVAGLRASGRGGAAFVCREGKARAGPKVAERIVPREAGFAAAWTPRLRPGRWRPGTPCRSENIPLCVTHLGLARASV